MTMPWCERQRQALRAFRQAITERAQREGEIAGEEQGRQRALEQRYAAEKKRVESEHASAQAGALSHAEHARQRVQDGHQRRGADIERDHALNAEKHLHEYTTAKNAMEADFRESRWTTTTVYEADKRVAHEQMVEAMTSCKEMARKLLGQWRTARGILEKLEFLEDIPDLDPKEISTTDADPWRRMQDCADQAALDLKALQTMKSPRFINGILPWLILATIWLVLSAPGILVWLLLSMPEGLYTTAGAALVLPIGYWLINRTRKKTNDRIIALWLSLRYCATWPVSFAPSA